MQKLQIITKLNAPVKEVWGLIGAVGGVDKWSSIINTCALSSSADGGLQRTCSSDNGVLEERILLLDHDARRLEYAITEQQFFPIDDLRTSIEVSEDQSGTQITTELNYTLREEASAEEINAGLREVYTTSYAGIEQLIVSTI